MPIFSVIIATYNRASLLPRALESVLRQSYRDFEIVVVDDGSVDNTAAVVSRYSDSRIRYLKQRNAGLSAARNSGVAISSGLYTTVLDDDDEALPNWLEEFNNALQQHGCAVVCCGANRVDSLGHSIESIGPKQLGPAFENQRGLFMAGTFAVRRDTFDAVGGFAEKLFCSHQTELALRLVPFCVSKGLTIHSIDTPLIRIYQRNAVKRERNHPERLFNSVTYIIDHHKRQLRRSPKMLSDYFGIAGVAAARTGNYKTAKRFFQQAIQAYPCNWKNYGRFLMTISPKFGNVIWHAKTYRKAEQGSTSGSEVIFATKRVV